jgi:hypothetical protein
MNKITEGQEVPVKAKKAKVERDPEMSAALKAKNDRKKAARFAARDAVIAFVKAYGDDAVKAEALKLFPGAYTGKKGAVGTRASVTPKDFLLSLFPAGVGTTKSGFEIFSEHNMGPGEMRGKIIRNLKLADPADRVWVSYNYVEKTYKLEALGAEKPEGWNGYIPVDLQ